MYKAKLIINFYFNKYVGEERNKIYNITFNYNQEKKPIRGK